MMLECLPDRCVPDCSLQAPQTVPRNDPHYLSDVQIVAKFAHSAQDIIRDIDDFRHIALHSNASLRPGDCSATSKSTESTGEFYMRLQKPFLMRMHMLIADFDRQCYDVVHRIRRRVPRKSSTYIHHAMSSNPPAMHEDAHVDVPDKEHPPHLHCLETGGGTPGNRSFSFGCGSAGSDLRDFFAEFMKVMKASNNDDVLHSHRFSAREKSVNPGGDRDSDDSCLSKNELHRSATSSEFKHPSLRRSETMPANQTQSGEREAGQAAEAEQAAEAIHRIQRIKRRDKERRRDMELKSSSKFKPYVEEDSDLVKSAPLKSSNQNTRSANYQSSTELRPPPMRRSETMPVDRVRPGEKEDDSSDTEKPVTLKSSKFKNMKAPLGSNDGSGESDSEMTEEWHPSPRLQRKTTLEISQDGRNHVVEPETYVPRPKESRRTPKYPFMGFQEGSTRTPAVKHTMPSRFSPGGGPPSADWTGSARVLPLDERSSHSSKLFGEAVPIDMARKTSENYWKTSENDKPHREQARIIQEREDRERLREADPTRQAREERARRRQEEEDRHIAADRELFREADHSSSKDHPPHLEEAPIRSDASAPTYEAVLSRPSQPNSASERIREAFFDFHTEYLVECKMFKQHPPPDEDDRKKLYTRLSETILQHVLLKSDAVETEDEVLKNKKKHLIVDAQTALEQLDRVMKAT